MAAAAAAAASAAAAAGQSSPAMAAPGEMSPFPALRKLLNLRTAGETPAKLALKVVYLFLFRKKNRVTHA